MKDTIRNLTKSVVLKHEDFLPVQEHQVLSLTFCQGESATTAFFSFDYGEGISKETRREDLLCYVIEGKAQIKTDEQVHSLTAGQCILIPALMEHAIEAVKAFKMLQITVS